MANVTFTLKDTDDGGIDLSVDFTPQLSGTLTQAQTTALQMLDHLKADVVNSASETGFVH